MENSRHDPDSDDTSNDSNPPPQRASQAVSTSRSQNGAGFNIRNTPQHFSFPTRPVMSHEELVALNHAALATMVRGDWTRNTPPPDWDERDTAAMKLHQEDTVRVDIFQLVPTRRTNFPLLQELCNSILVRSFSIRCTCNFHSPTGTTMTVRLRSF